jgi:hypothetical protein
MCTLFLGRQMSVVELLCARSLGGGGRGRFPMLPCVGFLARCAGVIFASLWSSLYSTTLRGVFATAKVKLFLFFAFVLECIAAFDEVMVEACCFYFVGIDFSEDATVFAVLVFEGLDVDSAVAVEPVNGKRFCFQPGCFFFKVFGSRFGCVDAVEAETRFVKNVESEIYENVYSVAVYDPKYFGFVKISITIHLSSVSAR